MTIESAQITPNDRETVSYSKFLFQLPQIKNIQHTACYILIFLKSYPLLSPGTDVNFWIDYGDGYVEEFYLTDPDAFVPFNHTYPAVAATYDVEVVATNDRLAKNS